VRTEERTWWPGWPCPVAQVLGPLRHGAGDPTFQREQGITWRGLRTPEGPATLRLESRPGDGVVLASAWGSGAAWALESLPAMLGALDDYAGFEPGRHPAVARLHRAHPHWRVPRTGLVLEALLPAVIEQKVTGQESFAAYRRLVLRWGEPAPGPGTARGLRVQPTPDVLGGLPSWEWLQLGVDGARARTVVGAARRAAALERTTALGHAVADRALRSLPGVGAWTSAEVRARAHGDPDAVSIGDYHVAQDIGFALTGERLDDSGLLELLEPFRGHRYRVQRLVELAGIRAPRQGPRTAPRTHLPGWRG